MARDAWGSVLRAIIFAVNGAPPAGLSTAQIAAAVGFDTQKVKRQISRATKLGYIHVVRLEGRGHGHYFPSYEAAQAGTPRVAEVCREEDARKLAAKRQSQRECKRRHRINNKGKPSKQAQKPAPKPAVPRENAAQDKWRKGMLLDREVNTARKAKAAPAGVHIPGYGLSAPKKVAQVIVPANVKVTIAAAPPDYRFYVDPAHRGEFSAEWDRLRGGGV